MSKSSLASLLACAFICTSAFAQAPVDPLWQRVEAAIAALSQPRQDRPKTQDEMNAFYKNGVTEFDAAFAAFSAQHPNDPRRWKARFFEASTYAIRGRLGLPPVKDVLKTLEEIVNAPDADATTKSEASAIFLLESKDGAIEKGEGEEWLRKAEAHLKNHPDVLYNGALDKVMEPARALIALKSKPVEIKFFAIDGTECDLAKMRGKVVLIDFWATWCGPCVAELPNLIKVYERLHDKGFEIVGVSLDDDKNTLLSFLKEKGMKWPQYFDGKGWKNDLSTRFGIKSIPAMWLVGKDGKLISMDVRGRLEAEVEKALARE